MVTEFAGALAAKLRAGKLDANEADVATRAFGALEAESFTRISVTTSDFAGAAVLVSSREVALRAGDALHLAIAAGPERRSTPSTSLCTGRPQPYSCRASW